MPLKTSKLQRSNVDLTVHRAIKLPQSMRVYVVIQNAGRSWKTKVVDSTAPEWTEKFRFELSDDSARTLYLKIIRKRAIHQDQVIASKLIAVEDLVGAQGDNSEVSLLLDPDHDPSILGVLLVVSVRLQSPRVSPVTVPSPVLVTSASTPRDVEHPSELSLPPLSPITSQETGAVWQSLLSMVSSLDGAVKLIDELAKVHPYLQLAWSVLSLAYAAISAQADRDEKMSILLDDMLQMYKFASGVDLKKRDQSIAPILERIARETVRCANFMNEYSRRSILNRTITSPFYDVDGTIQKFRDTFEYLRSCLVTGTALRLERLTSDLKDDTNRIFIATQYPPVETGWNPVLGCLPGTRQTVLDDIMKWLSCEYDDEGPCRIFLLTGLAGSGKSTVAHSVAEICAGVHILGSNFFFKHDVADLNSPKKVFTKMAVDLAAMNPQLAKDIAEAVKNEPYINGLSRQFKLLISDPLHSLSTSEPIVLLLDALDECGKPSERRELLRILSKDSSILPNNVRLFITSRPEDDIAGFFDRLGPKTCVRRDLAVTLDSLSMNNRDMHTFVKMRFAEIADNNFNAPGVDEDWPGPDQIERFIVQSAGLFIWASTALGVIEDAHNPNVELNSLLRDSAASRGAQDSLDALYRRILAKVGHWDEEGFLDSYQVSMGVIIAAADPLSLAAIDKLVGDELPNDRPSHLLSRFGSVLTNVGNGGGPVQSLHPSFSDFLVSTQRCGDPNLVIDAPRHHRFMALRCFKVLSCLHRNICSLPDLTLFNSEIGDLEHRIADLPEEVRYAGRFWIIHVLRSEPRDDTVLRALAEFLSAHAFHWLELRSLLHSTSDLISSLIDLDEWVMSVDPPHPGLEILIQELIDFCRGFGHIIRTSASHIYTSALPFIPSSSPLRPLQVECNDIPRITIGSRASWSPFSTLQGLGRIATLSFSPDRRKLMALSVDGVVCLWDTQTQQTVTSPFQSNDSRFISSAFFPDSKSALIGSKNGEIVQYTLELLEPKGLRCKQSTAVECLSVAPDGEKFFSSGEGTLGLWDGISGSLLREFQTPFNPDYILVNPASTHIVGVAHEETRRKGHIACWKIQSDPAPYLSREAKSRSLPSVAFSSERDALIVATARYIELMSLEDGSLISKHVFEDADSMAFDCNISQDGSQLLRVSGIYADIWTIDENAADDAKLIRRFYHAFHVPNHKIRAISSYGSSLAVVNKTADEIFVYSTTQLAMKKASLMHWEMPVFSPDGSHIAFYIEKRQPLPLSSTNHMKIFRVSDGTEVCRINVRNECLASCCAFDQMNRHVAVGYRDGAVEIFDVNSGQSVLEDRYHEEAVLGLCWHASEPRLASFGAEGKIRILDTTTNENVAEYRGQFPFELYGGSQRAITFSEDAALLALCFPVRQGRYEFDKESIVIVWNIEAGEIISWRTNEYITRLSFSPDGSVLWGAPEFRDYLVDALAWTFSFSAGTVQSIPWSTSSPFKFRKYLDGWITKKDGTRLFRVHARHGGFMNRIGLERLPGNVVTAVTGDGGPIISDTGRLVYMGDDSAVLIDFSTVPALKEDDESVRRVPRPRDMSHIRWPRDAVIGPFEDPIDSNVRETASSRIKE
ncbi:soluble quino protein glucose dehydrogenase [Sistotremastrum niveocremeum HHB9708]|uniref:Soluble quino protein glucose dehydrogenase n=1 Tax=Sistotremastrum niveocremeum HHB9708 TaxID=1314777 RepID=A0A164T1F8_9AGAM|nr:soluble quino protein glucose dehydrogenase [Sistotremastrum niveocremeum HHB9708]